MIPPGTDLSLCSPSQIDQNWIENITESRPGAVPDETAGARDMRTPAVQADVPVRGSRRFAPACRPSSASDREADTGHELPGPVLRAQVDDLDLVRVDDIGKTQIVATI